MSALDAPEAAQTRTRTISELQSVRDRNHLTLICTLQKKIVELLGDTPHDAIELLHAYNGIQTK